MLDLVLPLECGGCGAPGARWCEACATALCVRADEPVVITPRLDPGVPVFALGRYAGSRRQAIVALKEHGRSDLVSPLSYALAGGIQRLLTWGVLREPVAVVPAPTRRSAARRRGGDPVTRCATRAVAAYPQITVAPALRLARGVRDSVGLGSSDRQRNLAGRVRLSPGKLISGVEVLVVDDIVTTGATACESVRVLTEAGAQVAAVLTIAYA
jgi:predicted amidophosphoribosyltransferase